MFDGPVPVTHDTGDRIWVLASYADNLPVGVVMVGDGLNNGYDVNGSKLVSVPASWCSFIDDDKAASIRACIEADRQLRSYAQ